MSSTRLLIIGAGQRGQCYAEYARLHPDQAQVVGVAEPRAAYRSAWPARIGFRSAQVVADWRDLLRPGLADAVIIATPDTLHTEPAIAFAGLGYASPAGEADGPHAAGVPADRGGSAGERRHFRRRACAALYQLYAEAEGAGHIGGDRRHREHPTPGTGRLRPPGAFLRARELAQRGRVVLYAAGEVVP